MRHSEDLCNLAFLSLPLPQFFLCCSAVWRFAAELARALESHYSIPLLVSILSVLYHTAPAWWGGWPFVAKGFVLIFKVVWPHGGSDLVKTACPLLLSGHLWQSLLDQASVCRTVPTKIYRYTFLWRDMIHLLNPPGRSSRPSFRLSASSTNISKYISDLQLSVRLLPHRKPHFQLLFLVSI